MYNISQVHLIYSTKGNKIGERFNYLLGDNQTFQRENQFNDKVSLK